MSKSDKILQEIHDQAARYVLAEAERLAIIEKLCHALAPKLDKTPDQVLAMAQARAEVTPYSVIDILLDWSANHVEA